MLQLLQDLLGQIAGLEAKVQEVQAAYDADMKAQYDKGYADGSALVPGGDKTLSQAEAEAMVAAAVEPLNVENTSLKERVAALEAGQQVAVDEAVAALKADIAAKIRDANIDDLKIAEELEAPVA